MGKIESLATIVLCGGESRRMGFPKALLPIGNELLVERVCRLVAEVSEQVILVKSPGQILPQLPSEIVIIEDTTPFQGPLAGMAHGMEAIKPKTNLAFVTAVDTPLLNPEVIRCLSSQIQTTQHDLIMPFDEYHLYPLSAIYQVNPVRSEIQKLLVNKKLRPVYLMDSLNGMKLPIDNLRAADPELLSFQNINTRDQYRSIISRMNLELDTRFHSKTVSVEFYGTPRLICGMSDCSLQCDFYEDLIQSLETKFPALKNQVIFEGKLHKAFRLVRNGSEFIDNFQSSPDHGDKIMLISADVGG